MSLRAPALPRPVPPFGPAARLAPRLLEAHRQDPPIGHRGRSTALARLQGADERQPGGAHELPGTTPPDIAVRKTANLIFEVSPTGKNDSPIGGSVEEHVAERRARSRTYRETQERLRPFEEFARVVIMRRAQLGLTQQELADRMGTTKSVISRIESGQHRTSMDTLRRLAEALDGHAVIGFEFGSGNHLPDVVRL